MAAVIGCDNYCVVSRDEIPLNEPKNSRPQDNKSRSARLRRNHLPRPILNASYALLVDYNNASLAYDKATAVFFFIEPDNRFVGNPNVFLDDGLPDVCTSSDLRPSQHNGTAYARCGCDLN